MANGKPRIAFIGFGEAGQAIASGLRDTGIERIAAWDILFPEPAGAHLKAAGEAIGVRSPRPITSLGRCLRNSIASFTRASNESNNRRFGKCRRVRR